LSTIIHEQFMLDGHRPIGGKNALAIAFCSSLFVLAAGTQAAPNKTDKAQARQLVALGDQHFALGDYESALDAYRGADVIMGVPTTRLQVARAQLALNRLVEARETLRRIDGPPAGKREPKAFRAARAQAADIAASLDGRIPTVEIHLQGVPDGATPTVTVDGSRWTIQQLGLPNPLNPGTHEIAAWLEGRPKTTQTITLAEGEHDTVQLVVSTATRSGDTTLSPLVYVGIGVGGVGLIVGAVTGSVSLAKASEVKDQCFEERLCPRLVEATRDDAIAMAHVSTASFVVAGAGAVLGIVGLIVGGQQVTHARVEPGLTVDQDGLKLRF